MRYLAIIFLSVAALIGTAALPAGAEALPAGAEVVALQASVVPMTELLSRQGVSAPDANGDAPVFDSALAALLGCVLVALQLRRRQKSLRMPRAFNG
jgi:uncharacterized protein (UPF0261 family)